MSGSWHVRCSTVPHSHTWSPDLEPTYCRMLQVHVGWLSDGTAVLSFRGTATMQDGLADVQVMHRDVHFLRDYFPGSRAHIGGPRNDPLRARMQLWHMSRMQSLQRHVLMAPS